MNFALLRLFELRVRKTKVETQLTVKGDQVGYCYPTYLLFTIKKLIDRLPVKLLNFTIQQLSLLKKSQDLMKILEYPYVRVLLKYPGGRLEHFLNHTL